MLFALECAVQKYAWGKPGLDSTVAQLAKEQGQEVDEDAPYAELWMGTHPNGPAQVVMGDGSKVALSEWINQNPSVVSANKEEQDACVKDGLPYLFKILSVNTALSIQSHPDKKVAAKLHADRPDVYKDPNHKPEMACAITPFEALAGFLPVAETLANIKATPELAELLEASEDAKAVLDEGASAFEGGEQAEKAALRTLFASLMQSEEALVQAQVAKLQARLGEDEAALEHPDKLALRLSRQYPGDVGVFCAYFMCYRVLEPGQAVFLGANEPHAYLAGDCAEIMACSDNVVRAGLTPKLRDVETLVTTLTYRQPSHQGAEFHPGNMLDGAPSGPHSKVYSPPDPAVTEFQMERVVLSKSDGPVALKTSSFGCILLVLSGSGSCSQGSASESPTSDVPLRRGGIFFQPAGAAATVTSASAESPLVLFRASLKGAF